MLLENSLFLTVIGLKFILFAVVMIYIITMISGKIFAFLGIVENVGLLLYSPIYTAVYISTIHNFANCFFFLSAIFSTLVFVLFGWVYIFSI